MPATRITAARLTATRLAAAGAVGATLVAYGALVAVDATRGTLRDGNVPTTLGWLTLAWVGFALALVAAERRRLPLPLVVAVPLVARIALWFTEPSLSDDVHRYLWDGHLLSNGVNPYLHVVAAAELDHLDVAWRSLVNNPTLATPYLPAAQGLFALVVLIGPDEPLSMQVAMTAFDIVAAGLLVPLLRAVGLPAHRALLYWWNPLVVVESAHGAHLDSAMVALTLAGLLATVHWSGSGSGSGSEPAPGALSRAAGPVLLAAATLTRGLPLLLIPVLWWRWTWPQRLTYGLACALPVGLFALGPGLGLSSGEQAGGGPDPTGVFGTARVYAAQWQFNSETFHLLSTVTRSAGMSDPAASARTVIGVVMLAVGGAVWLARRQGRPPLGGGTGPLDRADLVAMLVLLVAYTVLTPTLHPWYLLLVVALAPFATPRTGEPAWRWWLLAPLAYLAVAVALSYLTYLDPQAHAELAWARRLAWYPALASGAVAAVVAARALTAGRRFRPPGAPH